MAASVPTRNDVFVSIRSFESTTSTAFFKLGHQHGFTVTEVWYAVALVAAIESIRAHLPDSITDGLFWESAVPADVRRWIAPELRDRECDAITAGSIYTPVSAIVDALAALDGPDPVALDAFWTLCAVQREHLHATRTDSRELETMPECVCPRRSPR